MNIWNRSDDVFELVVWFSLFTLDHIEIVGQIEIEFARVLENQIHNFVDLEI